MNIPVALGERSYSVLLDEPGDMPAALREHVPATSYVIITNETIAALYRSQLDALRRSLGAALSAIPDGEQHKHIGVWSRILDTLLEAHIDRNAVVLAFGGGVIGDMAGFAAATCLRGIRYVQIPTTLLAMVDSSVGGKTGVNHARGKNLIGAFHQPSMVWVCTAYLNTLPDREFFAGYGEVFKYAFIGGPEMASFIEKNHTAIMQRHPNIVREAIDRSIRIKAEVVSRDEREGGVRALLNFGHTFAHALETYFNYTGLLHGEAVFHGMACAIELSLRESIVSKEDRAWYQAMQKRLLRPTLPGEPDPDALFQAMFSDKKVQAGKLRIVVPTTPGACVVRDDITESSIRQALQAVIA